MQTEQTVRNACLGSGPDRDPFKGKKPTPGPGTYNQHRLDQLGGQATITRSCPSFSMQSTRRPHPRTDATAGPVLTTYSSFDD
jgi:hypothetical protein